MVTFSLTEEQKQLQSLAHDFAENEILPVASKYDESGEFPIPVIQKAFDAGLISLNVPEKYGGPQLSVLDECIVMEELGWGCAGISASIEINSLSAWPLILYGNEEQCNNYLKRLTTDRKMGAYCLTEPQAGSDILGIQSEAARIGSEYVIKGSKQFVTNGTYADFYVVFAYTEKEKRHRGISTFVIDRNTPGISIGKKENKLGQRASDTSSIIFEEVVIPRKNRLGEEGQGFEIAMKVFDRSRVSISAIAIGTIKRALECSIEYSKQRHTFGMPIYKHEAIGFMLADMKTALELSRLAVWQAANLIDEGRASPLYSAVAKCVAADYCMEATTNAVQIFGGYGYSKEYPAEKLMRDAKAFQIYEGTSQIQKVIITREMFK
jgi:acyl-CoA dehydrogenase